MLELNYTFTAIEPISHFGDLKTGNVQTFRRQKVALRETMKINSRFASDNERVRAVIQIILHIYRTIGRKTDYGGWSELEDKIKAYANSKNKGEFVNRLLESFECRTITDESFYEILDMFDDYEFLQTIREQYKIIVARVRNINTQDRENREALKEANKPADLFAPKIVFEPKPIDDSVASVIEVNTVQVPFISGNAFRGALRNIVMEDFCRLAEIGTFERRLPNNIFHQLFTGGTITESTEYEDLQKRKDYVYFCPMVGLLGSAIGNMTLQGDLYVGQPILKCRENGNGVASYWELMNLAFNTRRDDSKSEMDIYFEPDPSEETHQMIFYREEICAGAEFEHRLVLTSEDELLRSAFFQMIYLLTQKPYVGGNLARGCGRIELNLDPVFYSESALWEQGEKYRTHVQDNTEEIWQFFSEAKTGGKKKK